MVLSRRQSYKDLMAQANEAEATEKAAAENKRWFLQAAQEAKAQEEEDERLCAELRGRIADLRKAKEAKEVSIADSLATCSNAIELHNVEAQAETEALQARIRELQKECTIIEANRRSKVEEAQSICDADIKKYRGDISSLDTDITKAHGELQEYETLQVESADEGPAHGHPHTHGSGAANDAPPKTSAHQVSQNDTPKEATSTELPEELSEHYVQQQPSTAESVRRDNIDGNSTQTAVTEKRRASTDHEQSAHQNWLASAKDRAVEATPTMLQGEEIEEHSFSDDLPMVVFLHDRWHEMKCNVCFSNRTVDDSGKFFSGLRGLIGHVTQCHGLTNRADVISKCIVRTFTAGEIRALRSGIQPHPPIELSFGDTARRNERVTPKCTPSKNSDEEYPDAGYNASNGGAELHHADASTGPRESCHQTVESPEIVPDLAGAQSSDKTLPDVNVSGEPASNLRLRIEGESASMTHNSSKHKHDDPQVESQSVSISEMPRANCSSNSSPSISSPVVPSQDLVSPAESPRTAKPDGVAPGAFSGSGEESAAASKPRETQLYSRENIGQSASGGSAQALSVVPNAYPEATRSLSCSRSAGPENGETISIDDHGHFRAPSTMLSNPNLNVLHSLHPNTVHLYGSWCLIRCKSCHANAPWTSEGRRIFFRGIAGLQKHVREAHNLDAEYRDMEEWCEFSKISNSSVHRLCVEQKGLDIVNEPFAGRHMNAPPSNTSRATALRVPEGTVRDPRLRGREATIGPRLGNKVPAVPSTRSVSPRVDHSPFATPTDGNVALRGPSRPTSRPPRGTFQTPVGTQRHSTPFVPRERARSSPPQAERSNALSNARDTSRSPPYKKQKQREKDDEVGSFFKRFCSPAEGNSEKRDSPR
ncbi:hypothetical protein HII31_00002, partial [Pseudocercospora fuligena]